eukprot:3834922-Rhodomonas_salina.1
MSVESCIASAAEPLTLRIARSCTSAWCPTKRFEEVHLDDLKFLTVQDLKKKACVAMFQLCNFILPQLSRKQQALELIAAIPALQLAFPNPNKDAR